MTLPETTSSRRVATEQLPSPLGPTRIEEDDACNFALYSKHAGSSTLLLYTEGCDEDVAGRGRYQPRKPVRLSRTRQRQALAVVALSRAGLSSGWYATKAGGSAQWK